MGSIDSLTGAAPSVTSGGFTKFSGFGGSANGQIDLNTPEGLLALAQMQGGAVSQAANELMHPSTSILSTVGNGLKTAFKGFIDLISIPSEVVAGTLSQQYSIGEAIEKHLRVSDVIFGQQDPNATTMTKVGSFLVRTAADILTDPLTYVTFGSSQGLFGVRAATRIALKGDAAVARGVEEGASAALNSVGSDAYKFLKAVERQKQGLTAGLSITERLANYKNAKNLSGAAKPITDALAKEGIDFTEDGLRALLPETIDAPLNIDFAKQAMSGLLAKFPQLSETLLDKGGIKFFGKSIMSGQRIQAGIAMIPGMTMADHLTAPLRKSVSALFDPSMVKDPASGKWVRLPEEFTAFEQQAKDLAASMQDDRVLNLSRIVKANGLDVNESKFLMASVEAGKLPSDARLANAYRQLLKFDANELSYLRDSGVPISFLDNHAPHVLVKGSSDLLPFKLPPKTQVGAALQRTKEGTIFTTDAEKIAQLEKAVLSKQQDHIDKLMGEMTNAGFEIFDSNLITASAKRTMDNARAGSMKNFLDAVGENFSRTAEEAPSSWVPLNLSQFKKEEEFLNKIGQATQQLRFHPAVAKRLENFVGNIISDEATNDALRAFDSLQNLWKASVTSVFPMFHGRNALSNVFLHFNDIGLHSLNPINHSMASGLVANEYKLNKLLLAADKPGAAASLADDIGEMLAKPVFTDATGHSWSYGELRSIMKRNNIAFNQGITGSVDVVQGAEGFIEALYPIKAYGSTLDKAKAVAKKGLPISQQFKGFEYGRQVGQAIENQARVLDFIVNLRATGDVQLATLRTKQFLFDYRNLTAFEKTFLRRLVPFYTFTRKNIEAQVKTLIESPGRIAAQTTFLTNLGDMLAGEGLTPEQEAALPDWIKSGISILKKKNGSLVTIYGSLGTPIEQPFQALQPNAFLGSISPLIRIPTETATGYDFFQAKPISEITNATAFQHAPQVIKDLIGYTEISAKRKDGSRFTMRVALRPERMHLLLNLPPTSRVLSTLKQIETADVDTGSKILQQIVGVKPYSFDLEAEAQKRQNEQKAKLEELLSSAGVVYQFKRTYQPKTPVQEGFK